MQFSWYPDKIDSPDASPMANYCIGVAKLVMSSLHWNEN
ncbi:hypothetical protein IAD21_00527 [Abditibacteriota bacterium]|nr:hypothetical protein IAD21_00527 [Abditibacteriota bacterium]